MEYICGKCGSSRISERDGGNLRFDSKTETTDFICNDCFNRMRIPPSPLEGPIIDYYTVEGWRSNCSYRGKINITKGVSRYKVNCPNCGCKTFS